MKSETTVEYDVFSKVIISIHSLNEEWDRTNGRYIVVKEISIHSLNEEWDQRNVRIADIGAISIHSLNEEWDVEQVYDGRDYYEFQSTHSMKSETCSANRKLWEMNIFQSTHSMKSETKSHLWRVQQHVNFNPLTQWRVRHKKAKITLPLVIFQSTHSMKSETNKIRQNTARFNISIHSLNEEWDTVTFKRLAMQYLFQSTHSMKSETFLSILRWLAYRISIHSLNEEWDRKDELEKAILELISIHSLNEEWDPSRFFNWYRWLCYFNPLTQWRVRRTHMQRLQQLMVNFNPLTQWRVRHPFEFSMS